MVDNFLIYKRLQFVNMCQHAGEDVDKKVSTWPLMLTTCWHLKKGLYYLIIS